MIGEKWLSIRNDKKKGLSYSEIARKYNIDRRTAKKYCESNVKPDYKYSNPRKKKIDEYASYIDELLSEAPYSAVRIQELVEEHFHTKIGYTTIQEYVKKSKINYNHQATVRFETMPGLQGQVDWGFFENYTVTDVNGEEKKLYCFLMILGYSRMRYIEFVTDMSTQTLIRCHLNAFRYFGGYPEEILYDNMKQVVIKRPASNKYIQSTKTNAGTRKLPIKDDVKECFRRIIEDRPNVKCEKMIDGYTGFLCLDKVGEPLVAMHWEGRFSHMVGRYNSIFKVQLPKITPHVCRHTYCSLQAKAGMNPKTLQYLMGHSEIGVTLNTYIHLGLEDATEEMKRMEELEKMRKEINGGEKEQAVKQNMFRVV